MRIGVLALQGDYEAHGKILSELKQEFIYVRKSQDLQMVDGLIIPGGESTVLLTHLFADNFAEEVKNFARAGKPVFGTCAGAILMAQEVLNPSQATLGLINISIERNSYGRQLSSHFKNGFWYDHTPMTFFCIRAPKIKKISDQVKVLATFNNEPMCVTHENCLISTFHPELTSDFRVHNYFLEMVAKQKS